MKQTYWIADADGVKAKVEGAEARDEWISVRGWSETTEPVGYEFQWIRNVDHGGKGVMNHEAVLMHEGLGWVPSGPEGYDDEPADSPAVKPTAPPEKPKATTDKN